MKAMSAERGMKVREGFFRFALVLSILGGTIAPICHEWLDKSEVNVDLPENWKRLTVQEKLDSLDRLLSRNATFYLLSEIKQLSIRRQFRKMVVGNEDGILRDGSKYRFSFRFYLGWKELGLLALAGFASVWMICAVVRVVILLIPSTPMMHFPSLPSTGRVESLNFPLGYGPVSLPSVRITLFGFLVLEEQPKRPKKPRAVWID